MARPASGRPGCAGRCRMSTAGAAVRCWWGAVRRRSQRSRTALWRTLCVLPAGPSRGCGSRRARAGVLRAITPEIGRSDEPVGGADRPLVFEALLDAVEEATRGDQAILWVLDDIHWADD